jgi:hypothetical protein
MRSNPLLPILLASTACGPAPALLPAREAAPEVAVRPAAVPTTEPIPEPSAQPALEPEPEPVLTLNDPELECATFPGGKAPSARWLCELATGKRPASSLVDARGYAYVAYYGDPSDEGPSPVQVRERVCGTEAEAKAGPLLREIRQKLGFGDGDGGAWVSCKGMVCDVRAEGEWSTPQRLYFRQTPKGPVLEAWTRIEVSLIGEEEVAKRIAWIDRGRWALTGKGCR